MKFWEHYTHCQINLYGMFFADFSVNSQPIFDYLHNPLYPHDPQTSTFDPQPTTPWPTTPSTHNHSEFLPRPKLKMG